MSQTAYSKHFDKELDVKQLFKSLKITKTIDEAVVSLSQEHREWMRNDLLCPSCRCGGASIVQSDVPKKRGGSTRQSHFRFTDAGGRTAHSRGCDFFPMNEEPGIQRGVDVQFEANDKDTKLVRQLVCKAISIGQIKKTDITAMRLWYLGVRDSNTFEVTAAPTIVDWLWHVSRLYRAPVKFEAFHRTLPGFNSRLATERHLAFLHQDLRKKIPGIHFTAETRDRAKRIIAAHQGQKLVSMAPLQLNFEKCKRLSGFLVEYGGLNIGKRKLIETARLDPPGALLAFASTLLFVSQWDETAALERFAKILAAPLPSDLTLGNVIGLNPFHDFEALELARFASELPKKAPPEYDYLAEWTTALAEIEGKPTAI